ncbi:MAG: UvrB/UvrC motif-containing protein [Minisyncoccia bacterium]
MQIQDYKKYNLPDSPGVYFFKKDSVVLYIGKATSLKDRVLCYFSKDLPETRNPLIADMVLVANKIEFKKTNSVLEALILEANLIKKYQPKYNIKEKDDKSFNFVIITDEDFPRVLIVRGREIEKGLPYIIMEKFGPFTDGIFLRLAIKIIRKIFPFRDKCTPFSGSPCFNSQLGLCPGVCDGTISKKDYLKIISKIIMFLSGKTSSLEKNLKKEMNILSKKQEFEKAAGIKKQIFALKHIQDVYLIRYSHEDENQDIQKRIPSFTGRMGEARMTEENSIFRIEAYDIAHISGTNVVGAMTVFQNGEMSKREYRKFKIINSSNNDLKSLEEILKRRFKHTEWQMPNIVVIDGGQTQLNVSRKVLNQENSLNLKKGISLLKISFPNIQIVSVLKDSKHKPKAILGNKTIIKKYSREILLANNEAHRFALSYHRKVRSKFVDNIK